MTAVEHHASIPRLIPGPGMRQRLAPRGALGKVAKSGHAAFTRSMAGVTGGGEITAVRREVAR
jgi:hypothetical protein